MKRVLLFCLPLLFIPVIAAAETTPDNGDNTDPSETISTEVSSEQTSDTSTDDSSTDTGSSASESSNTSESSASSDSSSETSETSEASTETTDSSIEGSDSSTPQGSEEEAGEVPGNVQESQQEILKYAEDTLGIKPSVFSQTTGITENADIRKLVLDDPDAGITSAELDDFSDTQLKNAMTLFDRYSHDLFGMNMGAYVKVLRALYQDHSLNWEEISRQLAFDANKFPAISSLLEHVNELQDYLAALYPPGSSFYPAKRVSDTQLQKIIKYNAGLENQMMQEKGYFWPGRIAHIIQSANDGLPKETSDSSANKVKETALAKTAKTDKKKQPQKKSSTKYLFLSVGGLVILTGLTVFLLKKNSFLHKQ